MGIKIKSDGTVWGTKIYDEKGNMLSNVSRIEIEPIDGWQTGQVVVTAKLTFVKVELDIETGNKNLVKETKIV